MRYKQKLPPITPIIILLCILLMAFLSADASGQGMSNRVEQELQRTDRALEEAKSMLLETNNAKAQELYDQAVDLQDRAWQSYRDGRANGAMQLTANARNLVTKVLGLLHRRQEDRSFVEEEIERTEVLLERAKDYLSDSPNQPGMLLYEQAVRLHEKSKDLLSERNLKQALNLTLRSRKMLQKLVDDIGGPGRHYQQIKRTKDRLSQAIADNRELVQGSGNEQAIKLFDQAELDLEQADDVMQNRRWGQVSRILARATDHLDKSLRLVRGEDDAAAADRALRQAEDRYSRLVEKARELGTDGADDLLSEIRQKLDRAGKLSEQKDYPRVLVVVRVVIELEQQAAGILGVW